MKIAVVLLFFFTAAPAQTPKSSAPVEQNQPEVLLPLTPEERSVNPRDIVANQPDFSADLSFFVGEGFGGFGGSERRTRKGNRFRAASPHWIFVGELGKPAVRLFPLQKVYDDLQRPRSGSNWPPLDPQFLVLQPDRTFAALGAVVIDGHRCIKIQTEQKDNAEKIYLYSATDLKGLIIVAQVIQAKRGMVQRLTNISLNVSPELVEIPSDYKSVEHDRWTLVETARVTFKGKPAKDFRVFRSPSEELFAWIDDGHYPWTYLIRPREATRDTAFQGLLITRSGDYVWETKESEGFSLTHYRAPEKPSRYRRQRIA